MPHGRSDVRDVSSPDPPGAPERLSVREVRAARRDARRCDRRSIALARVLRVGGEAVTDTLDSLRAGNAASETVANPRT